MTKQGLIHFLTLLPFGVSQETQIETIELEPPFEPNPVTFSFDTSAWYVLVVCIVVLIGLTIFRQYLSYRKNSYRREAIKVLGEMETALDNTHIELTLNKVRIVLKQVAIFTFGRTKVAPLYGEEWIEFLESTGKNTAFSNYEGLLISTLSESQEISNPRMKKLITLSKKWIKTHAR